MTGVDFTYAVFGVTVRSTRPLRSLPRSAGFVPRATTIEVVIADAAQELRPPGSPADVYRGHERLWRLPGGGWLLYYQVPGADEAWSMRIEAGGRRIHVNRTAGLELDDILHLVQTAGLSSCLLLAGALILHGTAIECGDGAIVVIGPPGAGKSTTSAAFLAAGHALLTDDIAVIDPLGGARVVHPGLTQLRVLPESAQAFGWDLVTLPRVFKSGVGGQKRWVGLSEAAGTYCGEPRPIDAIYLLGRRRGAQAGPAPSVTPLRPLEAVPRLMAQGYRMAFLDGGQRARLLGQLADLASRVPVAEVSATDDLAAVDLLVGSLRGGRPAEADV